MSVAIEFKNVTKRYPLYHHIGSGIKELIFNPRRALSLLSGRSYLAIEDICFQVQKESPLLSLAETARGKVRRLVWSLA